MTKKRLIHWMNWEDFFTPDFFSFIITVKIVLCILIIATDRLLCKAFSYV